MESINNMKNKEQLSEKKMKEIIRILVTECNCTVNEVYLFQKMYLNYDKITTLILSSFEKRKESFIPSFVGNKGISYWENEDDMIYRPPTYEEVKKEMPEEVINK